MTGIRYRIGAAAVAAVAVHCMPSHAGIQLEKTGIGCIMSVEDTDTGVHDTSWSAQLEMGMVSVSIDGTPSATGSVGMGWLEDGAGFQLSSRFLHGENNDPFAVIHGRSESMVEFTLDESMRLDYAYDMDFDAMMSVLDGQLRLVSQTHGTTFYSLNEELSSGAVSFILEAGTYKITQDIFGQTHAGVQDSGTMSIESTMRFTSLPAPGALALLGLAGCARRRGRRV